MQLRNQWLFASPSVLVSSDENVRLQKIDDNKRSWKVQTALGPSSDSEKKFDLLIVQVIEKEYGLNCPKIS